ncbi:unnamed protein product [Urochloa decumbens]|uniref:Uncharacterized protein n=1 Tax=Urochloa decumbens TaxID=240449 RepID=A0ABC9BXN8_9POAL
MSYKRRRQEDTKNQRGGGSGDKRRRRRRPRKQHLYLVLDDWKRGYSIHKIDHDTFDDSDDDGRQHLPQPPALRLEPPVSRVPDPHTRVSFAALGTKLFALTNHRSGLVYDAGTAVLSLGAHTPAQIACGFGISVAAGDVLYVLSSDRSYFDTENPQSFAAMLWGPTSPDAMGYPTEGWSWKALPPPPFESHVRATALHPDGRTIFMTSTDDDRRKRTYSFDTVDSAWRCHENWALPFFGHGHFDAELDAWVGMDMDGHVCAGRVVSPGFQSFYPDWYCKKTEEKMFSKQRSMGASLTYMGASNFCVVDCVVAKHADRRPAFARHDGFVINLTVFGLKYNHRGELQIKHHRSTRSFLVSRHMCDFVPKAFWV